MRSLSLVPALFLALAPALPAQQSAPAPQSLVAIPAQPPQSSCPVSVSAQFRGRPSTLQVQAARPQGAAQLLALTLRNLRRSDITALDLTVYGFSPRGRALPILAGLGPDVTRPLHLAARLPGQGVAPPEWQTEQWIPGVSAVDRIELNSVTFADGAQWRSGPQSSCIFRIDGAMPVAASRP